MRGITSNGAAITAQRLKLGLTQIELADNARVDVKTVRKAEKNGRLDLGTLTRVALALETTLGDVILDGALPEDNVPLREVIIRWHRVWEAHNIEGLLALYTDDAEFLLPGAPTIPFGGLHNGKEAIRRVHESIWAGPKQQPFRIEDIDILLSDSSATLRGSRGIQVPSGELVYFQSVIIFRFRGNLIAAQEVQFDTLEFAKRMNLPLYSRSRRTHPAGCIH